MKRVFVFAYGIVAYVLFFAVYAYLCGFVGGFLVPKTVESNAGGPVGMAVAVDLLLLGLFAAQHSIMARPAFKRIWTRVVPEPIERSTYVFVANLVTIVLMWQWRGIDSIVWDVQQPALRASLWGLFVAGWLLVPAVSFMIHHFDLIGTRQVWYYLRGQDPPALAFKTPLLYARVRHPLYIAWALAFWAIPTMTVGHLLFAAGMTV